MHGHPGPAPGHYTPYPGPHGPPLHPAGFSRGRALPVMVACGLAMGVFVGLVVVRGTGEAEGSVTATVTPPPAEDKPAADKKAAADTPPPPAAETKPAADEPRPPPAEPPPPEASGTSAVLSFDVSPSGAAVTIDGKKVEGGKAEVKLVEGKARVRLVARADGYRSYDKSHLVTDDEAISIELVKKPRRSSSSKSSGGSSGPGGLIDLR